MKTPKKPTKSDKLNEDLSDESLPKSNAKNKFDDEDDDIDFPLDDLGVGDGFGDFDDDDDDF
ncbi:hypothetical protein [Pseudopedobacter beijingensis]|uniref:Uncharacterized protein n=1 Tax=Pseudopedobacter beijingensis TaxID=1207056 RepID=A0ABW4IH63_9SPHI